MMSPEELEKFASLKIGQEAVLKFPESQYDLQKDRYDETLPKVPKGSSVRVTEYVGLYSSNGVLDDVAYFAKAPSGEVVFVEDWRLLPLSESQGTGP